MLLCLYQLTSVLAQVASPEDPDGSPAAGHAKNNNLSFSGFKQGLRTYSDGDPDNHNLRNCLLLGVLVIILFAVFLNLRQRRKEGGPPDSSRKLARELSKKIRFPLTTRLLLARVAKTADLPMATLLISSSAFDHALTLWSKKHTFTLVRRWAKSRLLTLKPTLFD